VDFSPSPAVFRPGRYLTFRLARREFAIEADRVRGILPVRELMELSPPPPCSPAWARGVASLGGHDFPVIDLSGKLRLAHGVKGRDPMIVVAEVNTTEGLQLAGFMADRVSNVVTARERDYRRGKLRTGGRPRVVLDLDVILARKTRLAPAF
jgi:chemotaxis signal transduction protein